jgi:hypothetical protein
MEREEKLQPAITRLMEDEESSDSFCCFLEWLQMTKRMTPKVDRTIREAQVADFAAKEPVRVELTIDRIGAAMARARITSNLNARNTKKVLVDAYPELSTAIKQAG